MLRLVCFSLHNLPNVYKKEKKKFEQFSCPTHLFYESKKALR